MTPTRLSVWPPLPPGVWARRPLHPLPFPLNRPETRVYARARHGLWHGVAALGLRPGDEVLVPAYHHGSEVETLVRRGLVCRFYDGGPDLAPDEAELEASMGPRVRALYLTHFMGFPQDAARWRAWAGERGLRLIEDAAMGWLASRDGAPVGSAADLAIFCLYKTIGLPDGGAMIAAAGSPSPAGRPPAGLGGLLRRHGAWLAARSPWVAAFPRRDRSASGPAHDVELGDPETPAGRATGWLLPRLADPAVAARRRRNFTALAAELEELIPTEFATLPAGASPFVLPCRLPRKSAAVGVLAERGIDALDLWAVPHPALPAERFPRAARLRERVLGLPVHQELTPGDLSRVAQEVLAVAALG